jgi:hypothetical protein
MCNDHYTSLPELPKIEKNNDKVTAHAEVDISRAHSHMPS